LLAAITSQNLVRRPTLVIIVARSPSLRGNNTNARELSASITLGGSVFATLQEARSTGADGSAVRGVTCFRVLYDGNVSLDIAWRACFEDVGWTHVAVDTAVGAVFTTPFI
jgi:hypothetical protein